MDEAVRAKTHILVTVGTPVTLATIRTTTPLTIVFVGVSDPLASGIVDSLAHPGGNHSDR
jgi:putative ABC transport system substrate-binding protein